MRIVLCDDRASAAVPVIAITGDKGAAEAVSHELDGRPVKASFPGQRTIRAIPANYLDPAVPAISGTGRPVSITQSSRTSGPGPSWPSMDPLSTLTPREMEVL